MLLHKPIAAMDGWEDISHFSVSLVPKWLFWEGSSLKLEEILFYIVTYLAIAIMKISTDMKKPKILLDGNGCTK